MKGTAEGAVELVQLWIPTSSSHSTPYFTSASGSDNFRTIDALTDFAWFRILEFFKFQNQSSTWMIHHHYHMSLFVMSIVVAFTLNQFITYIYIYINKYTHTYSDYICERIHYISFLNITYYEITRYHCFIIVAYLFLVISACPYILPRRRR